MSDLLKKLQWKNQTTMAILNEPETFKSEIIKFQQAGVILQSPMELSENTEGFLVFAESQNQLNTALTTITPFLKPQTLLWICYPKKSSKNYRSDITRDQGWNKIGELGYEPVRQISIDDDWSALRFKPLDAIQKLTRSSEMRISKSD